MADDTRKVRVEERLKIKIGEAKNLPARSNGPCHRDTYCVLSLDQEEIFRTSTMEKNLNPFFGEEFQFEVPRRFRYLSIYVYERDKHLRQDKVLGKVAIKQEDLQRYNNKDHWFPLRAVDADSEVQGKAYIELTLEDSRKLLRVEHKPAEADPPAPPPPPAPADNGAQKGRGTNLVRIKESMGFSSGPACKTLSAAATEPALSLARSESLREREQWPARTKPPLHAMCEPEDVSPPPTAADYWSDPERHCAARVGPDMLRLRVLECSELTTKNGQCDPFASVTLFYSNGRRVERRTKPRKKTVNPQFNEIFCFDYVMEADPKDKDVAQSPGVACEARVSVWHDAATPVFLGEVRLQLRQNAPTCIRNWYFLTSRAGGALSRGATPPGTRLSAAGTSALGSLRLLLQYTVDHVFPLAHYSRLEELFLRSVQQKPITASAVCILGEIAPSKSDAAQPLVRLFVHHNLIVPLVKELADSEIAVLTDATTIFRGNTLVSKMMDEAMRLTGAAYLRSVLRPTLAAVLAERKPCEIDPARVKPAAAVSTNLANLKDYVERVFAAITSSYAACPAVMCRLFDALRHCAARHFPRNSEVRYSVVSGFIFLRFFAPAILGPRLFDLTTEQIDHQTNRTLTLISKTIQSLGNLVSSRSAQQVCKEEYMADLYKSFCTQRHVQAIRQFLEIISTSTDTQNNSIQETPVLLKEGTMIKRSEGVRGGGATSPRRRWARAAHTHAKRRHFRLTSGELTWSRCGAKAPAHRLPLSGVIAVAPVEHAPSEATLGANNIFQIVHRERILYVQASNCVERAEWVRLLHALCRHPQHRGHYRDTQWTCCGRPDVSAEGCGAGGGGASPEPPAHGAATLALRLDPARDLQRLHALLVSHSARLDERTHRPQLEGSSEERDAEAATLRELQEEMFDLEHRHRIYRRSLARETTYGSKQAPIGDDNYLHLAGAAGAADGGHFLWRAPARRPDAEPALDLDGTRLPAAAPAELASSSESLRRLADERSSGKSARSAASGYLTMSCLKHEPSEDSDASAERPARPPRAAPTPAPAPAPSEYVQVERACREYSLHRAPAVPPRAVPRRAPPRPPDPHPASASAAHSPGPDDSLLDELRHTCTVLRVCEDEPDAPAEPEPEPPAAPAPPTPPAPLPPADHDKEECGIFSRMSIQRKSNPTKGHAAPGKPLKTSVSTSNVREAAAAPHPAASRLERLTPFFLKKKPKPPEEPRGKDGAGGAGERDDLVGRLTPRFSAARRGQSLELAPAPRRIERSATSASVAHADSALVASLRFMSLHRYGAPRGPGPGPVQGRRFVPAPAGFDAPAPAPGPPAPADPPEPAAAAAAAAWPRMLTAAATDVRL